MQLNWILSPDATVPVTKVAVVAVEVVWWGLVTSARVVMSTTVQDYPLGAVAVSPMVTISVHEVEPTVKVPAVAPPAVALSVQPLLVVNLVPTDM